MEGERKKGEAVQLILGGGVADAKLMEGGGITTCYCVVYIIQTRT